MPCWFSTPSPNLAGATMEIEKYLMSHEMLRLTQMLSSSRRRKQNLANYGGRLIQDCWSQGSSKNLLAAGSFNHRLEFAHEVMRCPYYPGAEYHLQISPGAGAPVPAIINVKVQVLEVFEPITISPVLKVAVTTESLSIAFPSTLVLKVYDRRYAKDLRAFYNASELSAESEESLRVWMSSESGLKRTLDEWDKKFRADDELDIETSAQETEAYLSALLTSYYENEVRVYERMELMQGNEIPRFFVCARFINESDNAQQLEGRTAATEVPGILLEYVAGTRLGEVSIDALSQALFQKCVDIVLAFGDRGVLNQDVRLENFILPSFPDVLSSGSGYHSRDVVMIDFAQARLRGEDEGDEQWKREKWSADEEGAIGYALQKKYGWDYKPTYRYMVPAED